MDTESSFLEFTHHEDPAHGWFEVRRSVLIALDVDLTKISGFSYQSYSGRTVFLEEDCDVALLIAALRGRDLPFEVSSAHIDRDHWIRELPQFRSEAK